MSIVEKQAQALERVAEQLIALTEKCIKFQVALEEIRDMNGDWPNTLVWQLNEIRRIAKEALE